MILIDFIYKHDFHVMYRKKDTLSNLSDRQRGLKHEEHIILKYTFFIYSLSKTNNSYN